MVNDTYFQTINDVLTTHSVLSWCLPYTTIKTVAFLNLSFDYHNIFGHWLFSWSIESDLILSSIIKFKLQSAYSRVNFCGTNVCGNPFLVGTSLVFGDRWKNPQNFVPHGTVGARFCHFKISLKNVYYARIIDKELSNFDLSSLVRHPVIAWKGPLKSLVFFLRYLNSSETSYYTNGLKHWT